ncbi:hypothetical protein Y1Q_0023010 [Alligator mississippiensis]|uniref:Uncharacterized protein n=1 Tax=Alligator mississippiensis TaxID=8496 RepID=A0A151P7R2_ALLMI|nr:hypothetical protein Y1Q_0023010 [Alligator mississippiensis]
MAAPAPAPGNNAQHLLALLATVPRLLLATMLDLLDHCTDCWLPYGHLGPTASPTCSNHLLSHTAPSQCCCCHTAANGTLSCWPDPRRDTNTMLLDATIGVIHALLGLQPNCLWDHWASHDWWLHVIQQTWDDKQWLEAFTMTWATFLDPLEQLHLHLEQQDTTMWQPLPADTQLAIALL